MCECFMMRVSGGPWKDNFVVKRYDSPVHTVRPRHRKHNPGRIAAVIFGQLCILCGCKDDEADNVTPDFKRAWGYPPCVETMRNLGIFCWVCFKVPANHTTSMGPCFREGCSDIEFSSVRGPTGPKVPCTVETSRASFFAMGPYVL